MHCQRKVWAGGPVIILVCLDPNFKNIGLHLKKLVQARTESYAENKRLSYALILRMRGISNRGYFIAQTVQPSRFERDSRSLLCTINGRTRPK